MMCCGKEKKNNFEPQGWKTFATALRRFNIPQIMIGHTDRWDFMRSQITATSPAASPLSTVGEPAAGGGGGRREDGFTEVVSKKTKRKRKQSQIDNWTSY